MAELPRPDADARVPPREWQGQRPQAAAVRSSVLPTHLESDDRPEEPTSGRGGGTTRRRLTERRGTDHCLRNRPGGGQVGLCPACPGSRGCRFVCYAGGLV